MADIQEVRRKQLRRLVKEHEGMKNLASKLGLTKGAYISQLLTTPPTRPFTEKTARKWEKKLSLREGWFDGADAALADSPPARAAELDLLHQVIHTVADALHSAKVRPAELADLIVMQYADALRSGNADHTRIRKIAELLKN